MEKAGVVFSGLSPDGGLVEIMEYKNHPWFLGCQFHPEFKSRPMQPHPLFEEFVKAAIQNKKGKPALAGSKHGGQGIRGRKK